ncbi:hypothetical protein [Sporomusa malonica]|uniref:Uncharacterized protein n=1 Tax=Sporomusa malonica TaxID=112901 RepID=A0A1W2DE03_9FIRM|nr:hypothetical protein [Sporomusa malonica]SMC95711.1 hypothetical protein SAMN04488500_11537 [Sporomusa malonica]
MLLLIIAVVIGVAAFAILRPHQIASCRPDLPQKDEGIESAKGGMGSMMAGVILSYLVSNFLIDSHQYNAWRGLSTDKLKATLAAEGIMSETDFVGLSDQLTANAELTEAQSQFGD